MNKLLSILMVLVLASIASAVASPVWFDVHPDDKDGIYEPSDWITIVVVTDAQVIGLDLAAIEDGDAGGTANNPLTLNTHFGSLNDPGQLVNSGGILIKWVAGNSGAGDYATDILYEFEYHIPDDAQASDYILIGDETGGNYWLTWIDFYDGSYYEGDLDPVEIHVTPEPTTIALLGLGGLFLARRRRK